MTLADVDGSAALMAEQPLWQRYQISQAKAARYLADLLERGEQGLVASGGEGIQGLAVHSWQTFGDSGYLRILAAWPGRGWGGRLLAEVEGACADKGVPALFLLCSDFNIRAQDFYRHHGYVQVGRLAQWIRPDIDELIFTKRIEKGRASDGGL